MLSAVSGFMAKLWSLSLGLRLWLLVLMTVNGFIPLGFLGRVEAHAAVGAFLTGFAVGVVLFKIQGFTRLLGLMHAPWIPLIVFLWARLDQIPSAGAFGLWVRAVILLDAIALISDTKDVIKYLAGDRAPVR